jgi:hypothetical protein
VGKALIGTSSKLETTKAKFEFAFREMAPEQIAKRWQAVETAGLKTVQTTNDVAESMALLQSMTKADVFGDTATTALKKAAPALTNFGELFGDIASGAQFGTRSALWGLKGLLQGEWGSAGKHLDAIAGKIDDYKKASAGATKESERLIKLLPLLVRDFGGASAKMGQTFGFLVDQLGDIKDKFFTIFGRGTMDQLKGPLKAFLDMFVGEPHGFLLPQNIKMFDKLKDIFDELGGKVSALAGEAVTVIESLVLFFTSHPDAARFAVTVMQIVTALSAMVVVLLAVKAGIIAISAAFAGWTIPLLIIGAGIAALGYQLLKLNMHAKSAYETWDNLKLVFRAINELVFSTKLGFGYLDEQTTIDLMDRGLLGLVITVGKLVYRIREFFGALWDGLKDNFDKMKEAFLPLMNRISGWFGGIGDKAHGASEKWRAAGLLIADAITKVVQVLGYVMDKVAAIAAFMFQHRTLIRGLIMAYGMYKGGGAVASVVQKVTGHGGDPGGPTQRVFVVNWPGGGFGGRGGGLPGLPGAGAAGGAAAGGPGFLARTAFSLLGIFGKGGADGLLGSAAGTAGAATAAATATAAWFLFTTKQLLKTGWNKIEQLTPDQAKQLSDKASKAEAEAPSQLSSGMKDALRLEQERIARRRAEQDARHNAPITVVVNVDGTKAMEKKVETNADRSGQGGLVTSVP